MKKALFFITLLALGMSLTHAQTDEYATLGGSADRGIIREQNISYFEESSQGYFVHLSTLSGTINKVKTPQYWSIRDFHVLGNTAYFCGTVTNTKTALLGHFDITNLQTGSGNITFYYDNNIASKLSIFNRIAVSDSKGRVSIMSIGRESPGSDPDKNGADRVFYSADYASSQGCIFYPDNDSSLFWDVVATDNYFATSGTMGLNTKDMVMRSVPIGTALPLFQSYFSNGHIYTNTNKFASGIRASRLGLDTIAFATYIDSSYISWMQVFTINVPTAQMHYNQYSGMQYGIPSHRRPAPRDMVYVPDSTALMVIDTEYNFSFNHESILKLHPYPITAYFPKFYISRNIYTPFHSLVPLSTVSCMVASGDSWQILDLGSLPPPTEMDNCIVAFINDYFIRSNISDSLFITGFSKPHNLSMQYKKNIVEPTRINSPCQHSDPVPYPYPTKDIEKE
ncbi:MAG: hypothetical protein IKG81_10060 [Bacteroidales bacterium]|nr:hypothetical protein [Bacteroidales bacterium]